MADGDRLVDLGGPQQRAVIALLLIHANRVVSVDRMIDGLWGEHPPANAAGRLQVVVSNLRRVLEPGRSPRTLAQVLVTRAPGYVLVVDPADVDASCFEALVTTCVRRSLTNRTCDAYPPNRWVGVTRTGGFMSSAAASPRIENCRANG